MRAAGFEFILPVNRGFLKVKGYRYLSNGPVNVDKTNPPLTGFRCREGRFVLRVICRVYN